MSDWTEIRERLREFALRLPGAHEDFPWGDTVVKVNKKVFVFLGADSDEKWQPGFTVKLTDDAVHAQALAVPQASPSGYGLGRSGWVHVPLKSDLPPVEVLLDWVEESYRAVAPKSRVKELDETRS